MAEQTKTQLYIAGEWADSEDNEYAEVMNPATEETVGRIAQASADELDRAVSAANEALAGEWGAMTGLQRGELMHKLADVIEANMEELALPMVLEMGKTIRQAQFETYALVELFRHQAGWASKLDGNVPEAPGFHTFVTHEPVGVVGAITPFNVPIYLMATKLAAALAAGCTFIHKPASVTPLSAYAFAKVFDQAGFPAGVYNLVTGKGSVVGNGLSKHEGVNKIAFTGSTPIGIQIVKDSADTVKKVTMELGGKSPNVVLDDVDIDIAAQNVLYGCFINAGQICTATSRLVIDEKVHDAVLERLVEKLSALKVGDPMQKNTFMGPVAGQEAFDKITGYLEKGKAEGATVLLGGDSMKVDGKGLYIQPTIFTDVSNEMTIAREEIFGPVLSVIKVSGIEEAIEAANDTPFGLAATVQSKSFPRAHKVASQIKAGQVQINTVYQWHQAVPYGGVKMSGYGRENGRQAFEAYLQPKTIWMSTDEQQPFGAVPMVDPSAD